MDELNKKIATLEEKVDMIYGAVEQTRKYFKWTLIITLVLFFLPLIGVVFALPAFLNNYVGQIQGLMQ
jgi:TRAP-type mannitol/chloroaromatic compound transport system permease small subunit